VDNACVPEEAFNAIKMLLSWHDSCKMQQPQTREMESLGWTVDKYIPFRFVCLLWNLSFSSYYLQAYMIVCGLS
jgi:hypothetical protein